MFKKVAIAFALIAFITMGSVNAFAQGKKASEQPNFVVIFNDDLGYGDVGRSGSPLIQTPHIDRMETEGVKLVHHYSSANVCTPARAGLLTGRYPIRTGLAHSVLFPDDDHGLPDEEITLAEALKEEGSLITMTRDCCSIWSAIPPNSSAIPASSPRWSKR